MSSSRLAPRHRKFAAEYVKNGFVGVQAVYAAGYKQGYNAARVTAARLLTKASVVAMIDNHIQKSKMSADEVLERLAGIARTEAKFSGADVVKANELLGKGHKLFTDRVETVSDDPISSILIDKIKSCSLKTGQSINDSAINLFKTLEDWGSSHAKPENFGEFQPIIEAYLADKANQVSEIQEIGDQ